MKKSVKKNILKIKPYVAGKPIEEVQRQFGLKDVVKLASNENPYPPSAKVLQAINDAALKINRYPYSDCFYLKEKLAKYLKVNADQIIVGNGSDEIIVLAIRAFVNPGDEVIIAKPSFLIYEIASKVAQANIISVPLKDFKYNLRLMKKAITNKTKIIFLGNPDNPSGSYITKQEMNEFLREIRKDILIFVDEAYFEYVQESDYADSIKLLKTHSNVIVARTFSKLYGLAGLRIGYGIASLEVIDYLNRIREPFNVNSIAQAAAIACLEDDGYYKDILMKVNEQRKFLYKSLEDLKLEYVKTYTNFILICIKRNSSEIVSNLMKKGVIVRDMKHWGLDNFIRVSIGTEQENSKFISALESIL